MIGITYFSDSLFYYWVITFELSGSFHQYGLEAPKLDAQSPNLGYASKMLVVSTGTREIGTTFSSYTDTANLLQSVGIFSLFT